MKPLEFPKYDVAQSFEVQPSHDVAIGLRKDESNLDPGQIYGVICASVLVGMTGFVIWLKHMDNKVTGERRQRENDAAAIAAESKRKEDKRLDDWYRSERTRHHTKKEARKQARNGGGNTPTPTEVTLQLAKNDSTGYEYPPKNEPIDWSRVPKAKKEEMAKEIPPQFTLEEWDILPHYQKIEELMAWYASRGNDDLTSDAANQMVLAMVDFAKKYLRH